MKLLRCFGMALLTMFLCVNFAACGSDEDELKNDASESLDDNVANLVGKWKVEHVKSVWGGEVQEFDLQRWTESGGYPFLVFAEEETYSIDNEGNRVEELSYIYEPITKYIKYYKGIKEQEYKDKVLSLTEERMILLRNEDTDGFDQFTYVRCR